MGQVQRPCVIMSTPPPPPPPPPLRRNAFYSSPPSRRRLPRKASLPAPLHCTPCPPSLALGPPSILGKVFDVSKGAKHYGKGGAYRGFTGRDASRAFVSGDFTKVKSGGRSGRGGDSSSCVPVAVRP